MTIKDSLAFIKPFVTAH